jgi:hypothetical protein
MTTEYAGLTSVMPRLVADLHDLLNGCRKDVDGRDKPGHDGDRKR